MRTEKVTQKDIAIYALYILGGWQKRVHTEDIALKCYELAPTIFSWIKYPNIPSDSATRYAFEKTKGLVKGESERKPSKSLGGRMLTANGIEWVKANRERIEGYLGKHVPMGDRLPSDRKLRDLLQSVAFRKFMSNGEQAEVSHAEFAESLICTINTQADILNDRLEQIYSIATELKRKDIIRYVDFCRKMFASFLGQ